MKDLLGTPFPAVGVKIYKMEDETVPPGAFRDYAGTSYCEAVMRATMGEPQLLKPGSISVCRWSPPVLGLKEAESDFEKEREPKLPFLISAAAVARLADWPAEAGDPDIVLLRGERRYFEKILEKAGPDAIYDGDGSIDKTMVPALTGKGPVHPAKAALVKAVNALLDFMGRFKAWNKLTVWMFKREGTSRVLNWILDRAMANMSMCRNSTVIPYLTGRINVSHFCTGGISWGKNPPHYMTGGVPFPIYKRIESSIGK